MDQHSSAFEPERAFRGAGCTDACRVIRAWVPGRFGRSDVLLHDPDSHEAYARATGGPTGTGLLVVTGPLVIDRWVRSVAVGEVELSLSMREWQVLDYLAERLGRIVTGAEIASAIWGPWGDGPHTLRVVLSRLRSKLGAASDLLVTSYTRGYRLDRRPPCDGPLSLDASGSSPARRRWSVRHRACICCGRNDRPHHARGRCIGCQIRPAHDRWPHYGPCAAPQDAEGEDA